MTTTRSRATRRVRAIRPSSPRFRRDGTSSSWPARRQPASRSTFEPSDASPASLVVSRAGRRFAAAPLTTLSVERTQDGLRFRLDAPAHADAEPLQAELHQRVEHSALDAVQASATGILRSARRATFAEEAQIRGGVLYRALIPAALRPRLLRIDGPFLVSTTLHGLPWEL